MTISETLADLTLKAQDLEATLASLPKPQILALVNSSATYKLTPEILDALQIQINRDIGPAWKVRAKLIWVPGPPTTLPPADWYLNIIDESDAPGDLGWHAQLAGRPFGEVFVKATLADGVSIESVISHEMAEMLIDPWVDTLILSADSTKIYAYEDSDPVENDAYSINGVEVSNFVLPNYFTGGPGPWDHLGKLTGPLPAMTPGGYLAFLNVQTDGQWQATNGRKITKP